MITKATDSVSGTRDSLTGYEEVEIEGRFGDDIQVLLETRPIKAGRALAFVVVVRDLRAADVKDPVKKAYEAAMGMTVTELNNFFPDEVDELDADQPVTPEGKGD